MLARAYLRALIIKELRGYFGGTVELHDTRALPIAADKLPAIIVSTPGEKKTSLGRDNPISYNTTVVVDVVIRATGADEALTQAALEQLAEGVENATLANQAVLDPLNMVEAVDVSVSINLDGSRPVGEARMRLMCEVSEHYDPSRPVPLKDILGTVPVGPTTSVIADVILPQP